MHPVVLETMNDILNQVEAREWKRVTQQRDVLLRRNKKQSKKIQSMEDEWQVATEKLGQENSDLHNEIKRLKEELKAYKSDARNQGQININREKEIEKLRDEADELSDKCIQHIEEKQKLKKEIKDLREVMDDIEKHPDYEETITGTIEVAQKDLKEEIKQLRNPNAGKNRLQMAFDDIKRLQQQIEVLQRRNKRITKENEKLKLWCLSDEMIEQTSAETIEEFEQDVRDNWDDIENLKLELKAVKDANVMFMKRYEKKVEEEKKIDEVCSRIQCEDTFGHLIGRIPTQEDSDSDSDSDSDDDELDECFCCGKRFDSHNARYNMGDSLRLKYERYYGSENDDGDICPACIIPKILTDK